MIFKQKCNAPLFDSFYCYHNTVNFVVYAQAQRLCGLMLLINGTNCRVVVVFEDRNMLIKDLICFVK